MGFPEDLGKLALIKVKNESVAAAVEAVVALQVEQASKLEKEPAAEKKKVTVVQWNCEMCTVINQPGASTCHICFTPAPSTAFVDEAAEKATRDAEEKKKKDEAEKLEAAKRLEEEKKA